MNLRPRHREDPEINLISMIDVLLVLLIFFMVSTTFNQEGRVRVQLPQASEIPLPRGTHEYLKFIRPSELARWGREVGLTLTDLTGITYNPLTRAFRLSPNTDVNYLAHFKRSA